MDSPPSKRRKTSPLIHLSITQLDSQTRTASQDGEPSSKGRASFMSPTKASLARFNPSLLPPSSSSEPQRRQSQGSDRERFNSGGSTNSLTPQIPRAGTAEPASITGRSTAAPIVSANGQGLSATPRRRSRNPGNEYTPFRNTRPLVSQSPYASPPEGAREAGNGVHATNSEGQTPVPLPPCAGAQVISVNGATPASESLHLPSTPTHRGMPGQRCGMGFSDDGEPSLPTTPVHLGLEAPAGRPKGLLFSSPNRRSKRKGTSNAKSSPLKPNDTGPKTSVNTSERAPFSLGPRIYISSIPRPPPTAQEAAQLRLRGALAELERQLQEIEDRLIQQTMVSKWHPKDSKEAKEISNLRKDVLTKSAKLLRSQGEIAHAGTTKGADRELQIAAAGKASSDYVNQNLTTSPVTSSLTQRLSHFLPFGRPALLPTHISHSLDHPDAARASNTDTLQETTIAPLEITIASFCLLPPTSDYALLQRQDLILTSPQQLLRAKLQVTMDMTEQMVTELKVSELSLWAYRELGTWFTSSKGNKDLSAIGAAFGHYHETSKERAQCFQDSEREFRALLDNIPSATSIEHQDLSSYLGRQTITFSRELVALNIAWLVSFNDEGEVESRISAKANFPNNWQHTEGGDQLAKIGEAFDMLVKDRGVKKAISMICTIIFSS